MNKMFRTLLVAACLGAASGAVATTAQAQSQPSCTQDVTYCIPGQAPGAAKANAIAKGLGGKATYAGALGKAGDQPAAIVYAVTYPPVDLSTFDTPAKLIAYFADHPPLVLYFPKSGTATAFPSLSFSRGLAVAAKSSAGKTPVVRQKVAAGKTFQVKLKLSKAQAAAFKKAGRMTVTTVVTVKTADGTSKKTFKKVYSSKK
jgi:hypothetical protein